MFSIIKFFYKKTSSKRKVLESIDEMNEIVSEFCLDDFKIKYDGSYEINPSSLIIWVQVVNDSTKNKLILDKKLITEMRKVLIKNAFPIDDLGKINIFIESEETVNREAGGSWYKYFNENN